MYTCDNCKKPGKREDMVIDHILPRSHPDYNEAENVRLVHSKHLKPNLWQRIMRKLGYWRWTLIMWLDRRDNCHKTDMGYNCKHRIMSNGKKECD